MRRYAKEESKPMMKTVDIKLNKFPVIPNTLRHKYSIRTGLAENVRVNLVSLYHHYYLDSYGLVPLNANPSNFEYLNFLTNDTDFRIAPAKGIGASTAVKRNSSYSLGQAFCRMFLSENLGIVYFAHMDHILDKNTNRTFDGLTIKRIKRGDVPDYLCARNTTNKIYIGEAKGSYSAINFTNKIFESWREQFNRIEVRNNKNDLLSIKGYIVGTRFVTSKNSKQKTTVYVEDPKTPGEIDINEYDHDLKAEIVAQHYSNISRHLQLPNLSNTLDNYKRKVNNKDYYQVSVWKVTTGPLEGTKLIGKAVYNDICPFLYNKEFNNILNIWGLITEYDASVRKTNKAYFFGMHEEIFLKIINFSKEWHWGNTSPWSEETVMAYEGSSFLDDGTVMLPFQQLEFIETKNY